MPRLRVLQAFPVRTDSEQGYFYADVGSILDIPNEVVWQQLVDNGLGEATDPVVHIEIDAVVHRVAAAHLRAKTHMAADAVVLRGRP